MTELVVLTRDAAMAGGVLVRAGCEFLVCVYQEDEEPLRICSRNSLTVGSLLHNGFSGSNVRLMAMPHEQKSKLAASISAGVAIAKSAAIPER